MSDTTETKKKRFNLKGWWWKFPLAFVGIILLLNSIGVFGPSGLPTCDSSNAKSTLTQAFDQSQFARQLSISAIQINDPQEVSGSTEKQRICSAQVAMNNGETVPVDYRMDLQENGQFMLKFQVRQ